MKNGYATFGVDGAKVLVHRWSYEHFVGPIPDGLQIDHLCHGADDRCVAGYDCLHRRCVNPAHLEPVTARENSLRSTSLWAENAAKRECRRGHPFTDDNTYTTKRGHRACRECHNDAERERRARGRDMHESPGWGAQGGSQPR